MQGEPEFLQVECFKGLKERSSALGFFSNYSPQFQDKLA